MHGLTAPTLSRNVSAISAISIKSCDSGDVTWMQTSALSRMDSTDMITKELLLKLSASVMPIETIAATTLTSELQWDHEDAAAIPQSVICDSCMQHREKAGVWVDNNTDLSTIFQCTTARAARTTAETDHETSVIADIPHVLLQEESTSFEATDTIQMLAPQDMYTDVDVLLGRGGLVNRHPGNQVYLQHKNRIQPRYLAATKEDKTDISQELVDIVHAWDGRFMKKHVNCNDDGSNKWYEIEDPKARKKACQTLREVSTKELRESKRIKYGRQSSRRRRMCRRYPCDMVSDPPPPPPQLI